MGLAARGGRGSGPRVVALALSLLAIALGSFGPVPPAAAATQVAVTPSTGLAGGDLLVVDAEGFEPGELAGWCQAVATPAPPSSDDCGVNTTYTRTVAGDGSFSGTTRVERFVFVPSLDRWVDCADPSEDCRIAAASADDIAGTAVSTPISFAPVPPPPAERGTIVVDPGSQVGGGAVTVRGSGFRPGAPISVFQCAPGAADQTGCGLARVWWITSDGLGAFEVTTTVGATVDPPGAPPTSCVAAAPAERCVLAAAEAVDVPGTFVGVPVEVLAGEVALSPSTGIVMGPTIASVVGSSFPPGSEVGLCLGVAPSGPLRWWPLTSRDVAQLDFCGTAREFDQTFEVASVGDDGTFAHAGFRLERYVYVRAEDRVVDCADPVERCLLHVFATADVEATLTSVDLDIAPPPPPPGARGALVVQPSTGLEGSDLLTVEGTGFRPGALVDLYRCEEGTTERARCERLQTTTGAPAAVVTDASGALPATQLRMPAGTSYFRFSAVPDPYDCRVGSCAVTAAEAVDFAGTATGVPISYDTPVVIPRIVPGWSTVAEGSDGTTIVRIPVRLSSPTSVTVTARWRTIFGPGVEPPDPAVPGDDFVEASGTITFPPGETSTTIEVTVVGDVVAEPDEVIVAAFGYPTNAQMGGFWGLGFGIVLDDDGPPEP